jgi:hypothetical protein
MLYFPQINANLILTQSPYATESAFENIDVPVETGMVWSFPLRSAGLSGYPSGPLGKFGVNFSSITDVEVNTLYAFFQSVRGRWLPFRFLDPNGNLLQQSQLFSNSAWAKTLTATPGAPDPTGNLLGFTLSSGYMQAVIGPSDGGMSGFVMCASIYLKALAGGVTALIGFVDQTTSTQYLKTFSLPANSWLRISNNLVLPTSNQFAFYLNLSGTVYAFGAQVSPMKGEGAYQCVPGNWGYHANCRFDTDVFNVQAVGPNQNQLQLPIQETM